MTEDLNFGYLIQEGKQQHWNGSRFDWTCKATGKVKEVKMDSIYFTEEHNIFRKSLKDFVKKEIRPYAEEWEEAEVYPREIFKRMGDLGFLGVSYPEEYGGGGGDYFTTIVFAEEISRCGALGFAMSVRVQPT